VIHLDGSNADAQDPALREFDLAPGFKGYATAGWVVSECRHR
jgi:hypothetical protein